MPVVSVSSPAPSAPPVPTASGRHRAPAGAVRRHRRRGRWTLASLLACTALLAALTVDVLSSDDPGGGQTARGRRIAAQQQALIQDARLGVSGVPGAAHARQAVREVLADVPAHAAGVAAADLDTGASVAAGSTDALWTASLYKLLVLVTLLHNGGALSGGQLDTARAMIERSDNEAGYRLYLDAGGREALRTTMDALGMTHSRTAPVEPAFTRLTAADAVTLGQAVARPGFLGDQARAQALQLMRHVVSDQRWGAGVTADKGTRFANKNGWLSVDDDNLADQDDGGRWIVTTVGLVTVHGHDVVVAALTQHNATMADGITAVQTLSLAAVQLLGD